MNLAQAMATINVGPSKLARESGTSASTISDLRLGRIHNPGYQLVRRVFDALKRLGLDESISLEDVFPVEHVGDSPAQRGGVSSGNAPEIRTPEEVAP